eukprot:m.3983 g.3983  ORF g.3983 m.3983 type:complete len:248 (+) comp2155_c0_seq1:32-775(+)
MGSGASKKKKAEAKKAEKARALAEQQKLNNENQKLAKTVGSNDSHPQASFLKDKNGTEEDKNNNNSSDNNNNTNNGKRMIGDDEFGEDGKDPFDDVENSFGNEEDRNSVDSLEAGNLLMMIDAKVEKKKKQEKEIKTVLEQPELRKKESFSVKVFDKALDEIDSMMEEQHKTDEKIELKLHRPVFKFDADKFKQANAAKQQAQSDEVTGIDGNFETEYYNDDRGSSNYGGDELDESLMREIEHDLRS